MGRNKFKKFFRLILEFILTESIESRKLTICLVLIRDKDFEVKEKVLKRQLRSSISFMCEIAIRFPSAWPDVVGRDDTVSRTRKEDRILSLDDLSFLLLNHHVHVKLFTGELLLKVSLYIYTFDLSFKVLQYFFLK